MSNNKVPGFSVNYSQIWIETLRGWYRTAGKTSYLPESKRDPYSPDSFGYEYVEFYWTVRDLIDEYQLLFIDCVEVSNNGIM